jgi:hypothetical protein
MTDDNPYASPQSATVALPLARNASDKLWANSLGVASALLAWCPVFAGAAIGLIGSTTGPSPLLVVVMILALCLPFASLPLGILGLRRRPRRMAVYGLIFGVISSVCCGAVLGNIQTTAIWRWF